MRDLRRKWTVICCVAFCLGPTQAAPQTDSTSLYEDGNLDQTAPAGNPSGTPSPAASTPLPPVASAPSPAARAPYVPSPVPTPHNPAASPAPSSHHLWRFRRDATDPRGNPNVHRERRSPSPSPVSGGPDLRKGRRSLSPSPPPGGALPKGKGCPHQCKKPLPHTTHLELPPGAVWDAPFYTHRAQTYAEAAAKESDPAKKDLCTKTSEYYRAIREYQEEMRKHTIAYEQGKHDESFHHLDAAKRCEDQARTLHSEVRAAAARIPDKPVVPLWGPHGGPRGGKGRGGPPGGPPGGGGKHPGPRHPWDESEWKAGQSFHAKETGQLQGAKHPWAENLKNKHAALEGYRQAVEQHRMHPENVAEHRKTAMEHMGKAQQIHQEHPFHGRFRPAAGAPHPHPAAAASHHQKPHK